MCLNYLSFLLLNVEEEEEQPHTGMCTVYNKLLEVISISADYGCVVMETYNQKTSA